jgi:hypothetical protein
LVEDTRIDLGLVISMARWVTSHTIAPIDQVEANRANGIIVDLEDEVIFRVMEGLEDMVEEGVTTPSLEKNLILHQDQIHSNRSDVKTSRCITLPPIIEIMHKEQARNNLVGSKCAPYYNHLV